MATPLTLLLTIQPADIPRVIAAAGGVFGYHAQILDPKGDLVQNPETAQQFTQRMVLETVKGWVVTWESQQAVATAQATAVTLANQVGIS